MTKENKTLETLLRSGSSRSWKKDLETALLAQWVDVLHSHTFDTLYSRYQSHVGRADKRYKATVPEYEFSKAQKIDLVTDFENKNFVALSMIDVVVDPAVKQAMKNLGDYSNLEKKTADYLTQIANKGGQEIIDGIPGISGNIKFRLSKKEYREAINQRVTTLIGDLNTTSHTYMKDAFVRALASDLPKDKLVKILEDQGKGFSKMRAERIVRTETLASYEYMKHETARLNGITTKIWVALGKKVCDTCRSMSGDKKQIGQEFMKGLMYPPVHPNCVLGDTKILAANSKNIIRSKYSGEIIKLKMSSGNTLSVTPNHVIGTSKGFVSAHLLREGDNLLNCSLVDSVNDPNKNDTVTSIEDIFSSCFEPSSMSTRSVPPSPEYLHGDAKFIKENIDVISVDSFLGSNRDTSILDKVNSSLLVNAGIILGVPFVGQCDFNSMLIALAGSLDGHVSSVDIPSLLFGGLSARTEDARLLTVSGYDSRIANASTNRPSTDIEAVSYLQNRFPSIVSFDKVISIEVEFVHDIYIYDVSTLETVYLANGILSSNCECSVMYLDSQVLKDSMCSAYMNKSVSKGLLGEGMDLQIFCINPEAMWAGGESLVGGDKEVGAIYANIQNLMQTAGSVERKSALKRANSVATDLLTLDSVQSFVGENFQPDELEKVLDNSTRDAFFSLDEVSADETVQNNTLTENNMVYLLTVAQERLSDVGYVQLQGSLGILKKKKV